MITRAMPPHRRWYNEITEELLIKLIEKTEIEQLAINKTQRRIINSRREKLLQFHRLKITNEMILIYH